MTTKPLKGRHRPRDRRHRTGGKAAVAVNLGSGPDIVAERPLYPERMLHVGICEHLGEKYGAGYSREGQRDLRIKSARAVPDDRQRRELSNVRASGTWLRGS